ncbi:MAG TPA: hypothetical protein DDW52_18310, partial [Planctomycetaceae bacterium]|nr:hypothetical protein [Planctomycetaceae bacterium]
MRRVKLEELCQFLKDRWQIEQAPANTFRWAPFGLQIGPTNAINRGIFAMSRRYRSRRISARSRKIRQRRLRLETLEDRRLLATFAVNSTAFELDGNVTDGICDTGSNRADTDPPFIKTGICTLAAAAMQADESPSHDTITFGEIGGGASPTIDVGRSLSVLHPLTIDGTTHGSGRVQISGSVAVTDGALLKGLAIAGHSTALTIGGTGNTVINTYVGYDANGIDGATDDSGWIRVQGSDNTIGTTDASERNIISGGIDISGNQNLIIGNFVGVDSSGSEPSPAPGVVRVDGLANTIGGAEEGEGNVLVGGILVDGDQVIIQGNLIGTDSEGMTALKPAAGNLGVSIRGGEDVQIGGTEPGEGNLISGMHFGIVAATGASDLKIWGNMIGTDAAGDEKIGNLEAGIQIGSQFVPSTSSQIQIGGSTAAHGNLISGNGKGIAVARASVDGLEIANNRIGTSLDGSAAVLNEFGIAIENSPGILIGGEQGNLISGNDTGIVLTGPETTEVYVLNNLIGTNAAGTSAVPNVTGVSIIGGANANHIGGPLPSSPMGAILGNVISGSVADIDQSKWGVGVWIINSDRNLVQGNRIGTNAAGTAAIGNEGEGILVFESVGTMIGDSTAAAGNLISGNGDGILLWSTNSTRPVSGTTIKGNRIGTDASGASAIPNRSWGVHLTGHVRENEIGGADPLSRNLISGNELDGILLYGPETTNNSLHGNYIGLDSAGMVAVPNGRSGILVEDSGGNKIGLREPAGFARNVISGNVLDGVSVKGIRALQNTISANIIGLNASGTGAVGNGRNGIELLDASETIVGGSVLNDRNIISGNKHTGIYITGELATANEVYQNYIGVSLDGSQEFGNEVDGLAIVDAAENIIGKVDGTAPLRNIVSGNTRHGAYIAGEFSSQNVVQGNWIGLAADGTTRLSNGGDGIRIDSASNNRIGTYLAGVEGALSQAANVISGNEGSGVAVVGAAATGNQIVGNGIGTGGSFQTNRTTLWGNFVHGVHVVDSAGNFIGGGNSGDGFTGARPTMAIPGTSSLPDSLPGNTIIGNAGDGVRIEGSSATTNRILRNVMHDNVGLGIDLGNRGSDENDATDADDGPNGLQNYPEIVNMFARDDDKFVIQATFTSKPNSQYLIQTFRNARREQVGQGERLIDTQVVQTGADGTTVITVVTDPAPAQNGVPQTTYYAMTATDEVGSSSEFSPSSALPELYVKEFSIALADLDWEADRLVWTDTVDVCNAGGRDAEDVPVTIEDLSGNAIQPGAAAEYSQVDLPAAVVSHTCVSIPIKWDLTDSLVAGEGQAALGITVSIDPDDDFGEEIETNNVAEATRRLNVNPVMGETGTEFLPGYFVDGISMNNEVFVDSVDWNGDLPDSIGTGTLQRRLRFRAGTQDETRVVSDSRLQVFEFDIGNHLARGSNQIRLEAFTHPEFNASWTQTTHLVGPPSWLGHALLQGKEEGAFGKRVGLYTQKFGFPGAVTSGFFNIPASEIKLAKGEVGPEIGEYEVEFEYRSNGDGTLKGKAPWSGKVAGKKVLPDASVILAGTVGPLGNDITLKKAEATWELSGEQPSPRIRLAPPFSFLEVYGYVQGSVAVTTGVEQTEEGLEWSGASIGLSGGVIGMIGAGYRGALNIAGGVGVKISPTFNLSLDCILDELTANMIVRAEASALGYEVVYTANVPDPPLRLAG